jgi:hypothetical protein
LLFTGKPPVDTPYRNPGVVSDAGDGELIDAVVDQHVLGRGE